MFDNSATSKATAASGTSSIPIAIENLLPPTERISESFIEIRDRQYRDLIPVIELLSPTNKTPGPDRELYLAKRKLLTASNAHFVEIDLLRGGARIRAEGLAHCDYAIMVSRSYERPQVGLWPMKLREPLPSTLIPLKREDPDAIIDLQQLLHTTFDAAGYADYIYQGKPRPPLHPEEESWAAAFRSSS